MVAQRRRPAEHPEEPPPQALVVAQRPVQLRPALRAEGLAEPFDGDQREVGVRRPRQGPHDDGRRGHRVVAVPPAEVGEATARVGIRQPEAGRGASGTSVARGGVHEAEPR